MTICDHCKRGARIGMVLCVNQQSITIHEGSTKHHGWTIELCEKCRKELAEIIGVQIDLFTKAEK